MHKIIISNKTLNHSTPTQLNSNQIKSSNIDRSLDLMINVSTATKIGMFKRSAGTLNRSDSPATRKKQKVSDGDSVKEDGQQLLGAIEDLKDPSTQRVISAEFQKLPSRKLYPDYYQLIKKPIALSGIQSNLNDGEYVTLDLMKEDLLQMCNNAKRYNQRGSILYSDAAKMARLVKNWSGDAENYSDDSDLEEAGKGLSAKNYRSMLNQIIKGIMKNLKAAKDRSGRLYSDIFLELPDKKLYPDYYTIITNPVSFNTMEVRIKKNPYTKLEKFQEHINQVYENAYIYNDARSQVAQDARHLQKLTNKLVAEAQIVVAQKEKELAEQAKKEAKASARIVIPKVKPESQATAGGFKIKLGLRQATSTPVKTPSTKIKLHLGGTRNSTSAGGKQASPAPTPVPAKTPTPIPRDSPGPAKRTVTVKQDTPEVAAPPPVIRQKSATPIPPRTATPAQGSTPLPNPYDARPTPTTAAPLVPTNVFETPLTYSNSGSPLILFLSLCASQIQPPLILHIPATPGVASLMYSWTLPITGSAMTVSPSLCQSLLDGKRGYAVTMTLNGRKVMPTRQSNTQTLIKNSIWDLKLSAGMNCIECIVEAESKTTPAAEMQTSTADNVQASATPASEKPVLTDGKDRERIVVLAFLR